MIDQITIEHPTIPEVTIGFPKSPTISVSEPNTSLEMILSRRPLSLCDVWCDSKLQRYPASGQEVECWCEQRLFFTVDGAIEDIVKNKDLLFSVYTYKSRNLGKDSSVDRNRLVLVNDKILHDPSLKLYAWELLNEDGTRSGYFYYTTEHYDDSAEDLIAKNPQLYIKRKNIHLGMYNNSRGSDVVLLNQLIESGYPLGELVTDVVIIRSKDRDTDAYVLPKRNENWESMSKVDKLKWIIDRSVTSRERQENIVATDMQYIHYMDDFPVIPIRLGECMLAGGRGIKIDDLTGHMVNELYAKYGNGYSPMLICPYSATHLHFRFWHHSWMTGYDERWSLEAHFRFNTKLRSVIKVGSGDIRLNTRSNFKTPHYTTPLYFTLLTSKQIKHGLRSTSPLLKRTLRTNQKGVDMK